MPAQLAALALISKISEARAEAELPAVVSLKCLVHLAKNIGVELGVQIDELLVAHFKKLPAPVAEALPLQIRDARQSRLREGWFFSLFDDKRTARVRKRKCRLELQPVVCRK